MRIKEFIALLSLVVLMTLATIAGWAAPAAAARSQGPKVAIGVTSEDEGDLIHTGIGWRWEFDAGQRADDLAKRIGTALNWVVEPQVAILSGDRDGVEFQVMPMFQLTPRSWREWSMVPYLEGGIGLIYIDVTGFDMGSQILFSDNLGLRLDFGDHEGRGKWSAGYRFRHISHAGIWATSNSGMNTHWFGVTYQMPTSRHSD